MIEVNVQLSPSKRPSAHQCKTGNGCVHELCTVSIVCFDVVAVLLRTGLLATSITSTLCLAGEKSFAVKLS